MAAGLLVASCVWRASPEVVVALDARFGVPVDTYVNGSQVWIREDGTGGQLIEWRLHPAPGYRRPAGVTTEEVFAETALALDTGGTPPAELASLWDGLEAFPVSPDDGIEPQPLAAAASAALGIPPDAVGLVDHEQIADRWERSGRKVSIVEGLLSQMGGG